MRGCRGPEQEAVGGSRAAVVFGASINSRLAGAQPDRALQLQRLCNQARPLLATVGTSWARRQAVGRHGPQALTRHPSPLPPLWMPSRPAMLLGGLLLIGATVTVAQRRGQEAGGRRRAHRVQHGQCSYTFVLPEPEPCPPDPEAFGGSNSLQRDSPAAALNLGDWPTQRVRQLEKMLENNTQWLQKVRAGPAGGAVGGEQLVEYPCQKPALGTDSQADRTLASALCRLG